MNWSALVVSDVPIGVTTRTSIVPAPTGATAVMFVGEVTVKLEDALAPKSTAVAPVKSVPVISTGSPPPAVPLEGFTEVTDTGGEAALELL